jgi:hypothetical protein
MFIVTGRIQRTFLSPIRSLHLLGSVDIYSMSISRHRCSMFLDMSAVSNLHPTHSRGRSVQALRAVHRVEALFAYLDK